MLRHKPLMTRANPKNDPSAGKNSQSRVGIFQPTVPILEHHTPSARLIGPGNARSSPEFGESSPEPHPKLFQDQRLLVDPPPQHQGGQGEGHDEHQQSLPRTQPRRRRHLGPQTAQ